MSSRAKASMAGALAIVAGTVWYVHKSQDQDREELRSGVYVTANAPPITFSRQPQARRDF